MPRDRPLSILGWLLALTTGALIYWVASNEWANFCRADTASQAVQQLRLALTAAEMVSKERGPTNGVLGDNTPANPERGKALREARDRTDKAFRELQNELESERGRAIYPDLAEGVTYARRALIQARSRVDRAGGTPRADRSSEMIKQAVAEMVALVPMLAPTITSISGTAQRAHPELGDFVTGARLAAELREYAGLIGSLFTPALVRQTPFTLQEKSAIDQTQGRIDQLRFLLNLQVQNSFQTADMLRAQKVMNERYFSSAASLLSLVITTGSNDGRFKMAPAEFAKLYVPDMNSILGLRDAMLDAAKASAEQARHRALLVLSSVCVASFMLMLMLLGSFLTVYRRLLDPLTNPSSDGSHQPVSGSEKASSSTSKGEAIT